MSFPPERLIKIVVATENSHALLQGLDTWLHLNLDSDTQISVTATTQSIKLNVSTEAPPSVLLEGLKNWLQLGLLSNAQMSVEVSARASQPNLIEGLDTWVQLGLMTHEQVKQLGEQHLSCPLPVTVTTEPRLSVITTHTQPPREKAPSLIAQIVQSLLAELSVVWLLLLGVFMVVVSSGVLAASQWQKFPAVGQYGVLFLYTLAFGVANFWAGRQGNLRLTAQALRVVTLLLVPVNFLAIDSFGLWWNPLDWLIVAIAALILTSLTIYLLRRQADRSVLLNHLGLSYLHLCWQLPGFPLAAVYIGTVGTSIFKYQKQQTSIERSNRHLPVSLSGAVVLYAVIILLVRAIFIARVDVAQLGLALGICGILLAWQNRPSQIASAQSRLPLINWEQIGGSLLLSGWLVSVVNIPAQAIAVSGLGLVFFSRRLLRSWHRTDLAALFVIGLQIHWLAWRLIPQELQQGIIAFSTQLTNSQDTPWALLSLAFFPYLVFVTRLISQLQQRQSHLSTLSVWLALGFGTTLTCLSLVNPILRTLNLAMTTVNLVALCQQPWGRNQRFLVYLTHTSGLLTLIFTINCFLPTLNLGVWARIFLVLMVVEWLFSHRLIPPLPTSYLGMWQQSCWHLGLVLAALSYCLLLRNQAGGITWLATPIALTWVTHQTEQPQQQLASWLSILALILLQALTLTLPETRLIGLGVAVGLMLFHARLLQHLAAAAIAVGFCVSFVAALWKEIPIQKSSSGWFLLGAIALTILWLAQNRLSHRPTKLAQIYTQATDGWAIALCSVELSALTLYSLQAYWTNLSASVVSILAIALMMGAIAYRSWQHPNNWAIYGFGWGLEILTVEVLSLTNRSLLLVAIANIILGLITQIVGDLWHRRSGHGEVLSSWHVMPLLYGVLGASLRWGIARWTGLITMGLALIAIGVGRRQQKFKPLVYLAVVGVTVSAYEILLSEISYVSVGEQLLAMAALATSFVYAYRVLSPWLISYLHLTAAELRFIAHLHWSLGSCLLAAALSYPVPVNSLFELGIGIFLCRYAIMQGRNHSNLSVAQMWVYAGVLGAVGIGAYGCRLLVPALLQVLLPWRGAIATIAAYFLYTLPWQTWGWPLQPWQRVAFVLPLIAIGTTAAVIHPFGLLVAASFYVILAQLNQQIRFTYVSLLLIDWAIVRWLWSLEFTEPLLYPSLLGLSLLYVAQVDPLLNQAEQKQTRHFLRQLGTSIICIFALFQYQNGILPGILSIGAIFAGLALRVRAFLYVGTLTFLVNAFYQLVILIFAYPLLKWIVGLMIGITFIWIAASFENRRNQLNSLLQNWLLEFQEWQ